MKTWLLILTVIALAVVTSADVLACGDKYFVPGRGARFVPTASERSGAAVLFYAPPTSALGRSLAQLKADAALRKVGYNPTVATKPEDVSASATKTWDLVVVSTDERGLIQRQMPSVSQTKIVAVMTEGTNVQLAAARKDFPAVVRNPTKQDFLDMLDDVAARSFAERTKTSKGR